MGLPRSHPGWKLPISKAACGGNKARFSLSDSFRPNGLRSPRRHNKIHSASTLGKKSCLISTPLLKKKCASPLSMCQEMKELRAFITSALSTPSSSSECDIAYRRTTPNPPPPKKTPKPENNGSKATTPIKKEKQRRIAADLHGTAVNSELDRFIKATRV